MMNQRDDLAAISFPRLKGRKNVEKHTKPGKTKPLPASSLQPSHGPTSSWHSAAQAKDHFPEPVNLAALDHFDGFQTVEGVVGSHEPPAQ
jgi:hypothetical protein